ncbi:MAG: HEAT repeat domain-containing protein [Planctomycetota bacterium]
MKTLSKRCLSGAAAIALSAPLLFAHGGMYRGPGDTVRPPGGGGGRPTTPGPGGPGDVAPPTGGTGAPTAPGPTAPQPGSTGGGTGPLPSAPGVGRPRTGVPIGPDLTEWTFWWEFNKHSYLQLRAAVHDSGPATTSDLDIYMGRTRRDQHNLLEPTAVQIQDEILPALKKAIDSTEQRDITSSCMVAMAKIGKDHRDFALVDVFKPRLARRDQEIRETAALAVGIAATGGDTALTLLEGLVLDNDEGREARGGSVDVRTRSFAIYALGLFANEHTDPALKQRALATLRRVLEDDRLSNRNLKVAAIEAIGLLQIDRAVKVGADMIDEAVDALLDYYHRDLGAGDQLIQAHCPTAIVKLIGRDHPRSTELRELFAKELRKPSRGRNSDDLARSQVLALGQLSRPRAEAKSPDAHISELLADTWKEHRDPQTRYFAAIALGQIGGQLNRDVLLRMLDRGNKALERPWAAIALGVLERSRWNQELAAGLSPQPDPMIGDALLAELRDARAPTLVGALAVGLGLGRCSDAAMTMRERLLAEPGKEEQAGYLCIGLALMRDTASVPAIEETMQQATRRVSLFAQAAIALGCLGDKRAAEILHDRLGEESSNLATLSAIATAIGHIGDRRSVDPLCKVLFDEGGSDLRRAFAAVALGAVADRHLLPWHAKLSADINYRASVETLTDQQSGVLDIL